MARKAEKTEMRSLITLIFTRITTMAIRVGSEYIAYRVRRFVFLTQLAWGGVVIFLTALSLLELLANHNVTYAMMGLTTSFFITMIVAMQQKIMRTELANLEDEIEAEIYHQRHRLGLP